jgi:hypothetical protein
MKKAEVRANVEDIGIIPGIRVARGYMEIVKAARA